MTSQQDFQSPQLLNELALVMEQELREFSFETLRGLDETLRKLRSSVSRRLNEMRPVNRLPLEILLRIFGEVRAQKVTLSLPMVAYFWDFPRVADVGPAPAPDTRSLIAVTHVCRQWRNTALALPSLWADIVAGSAPAARAFMSRAGSLPIRVHVTVVDSKLSKSQKKVLRCLLPHIRGLVLRLRYRIELQLFKAILPKFATSLVDFGIVVRLPDPYRCSLFFGQGIGINYTYAIPESPWFAHGVSSLRITRGSSSPALQSHPIEHRRRQCGQFFLALFGTMPALERLVVRATTCDVVLPDLCSKLVVNPPHGCPSLHTVIFSVLRPCCALEDLQALFGATAQRAALNLGTPLKRLIVCSPTHAGPDYSIYGCHGVEWITFSSADAGSSNPESVWTEWNAELTRGAQLDPDGDGPIWGELNYDQAWAACAFGSVDCGATRLSKVGVSVRR
ncbi:hypothetical protein GY45DRAFT_1437212 [Cubamyces sp. BRFM 1775]|nr:hypothetical protein GY45DRAFT_1437212 [Cubamyces sp. BRFM 1775]